MTATLMYGTPIPLEDEAYHLLNEFLEERFGLVFPEHRRAILESRLQARLRALHLEDFLEYYAYLRANGEGERRELARAVTNNETYFFRERDHFDALFTDGVARFATGGTARLRILSAGCSSGEEAYTLSFFARHAGASRPVPVTVDGFDLDSDRLAIARRGEFRPRSVRHMTEDQVRRYLEPAGPDRYLVREAYRDGVTFSFGNLVEAASFRRAEPYDVVFCRNVLIYFSAASLRRAITNLASVLRPGGLLFLGHSESIIGMFPGLETLRLGRCIVYHKTSP
jgi:chemotaxis protein methyltransferase CheR